MISPGNGGSRHTRRVCRYSCNPLIGQEGFDLRSKPCLVSRLEYDVSLEPIAQLFEKRFSGVRIEGNTGR